MGTISNMDGSLYTPKIDPRRQLTEAVEYIIANSRESLLGQIERKNELDRAESLVKSFLLRINTQANLLGGNYEA
jgi:hypothetical protein